MLWDHSISSGAPFYTSVCELSALILLRLGSDFLIFQQLQKHFLIALYICIYNTEELSASSQTPCCTGYRKLTSNTRAHDLGPGREHIAPSLELSHLLSSAQHFEK